MITANQIHARCAQQQFQAFCRKWADPYGVACVKNRIGTLEPNCFQGNLKCRQIAVDICQYRDLHVPLTSFIAILNLHIDIEIDDVPIRIAKPNGPTPPRLSRGRFNNLNIHGLQTLKFLVDVFYLKLDSIATISSSLQASLSHLLHVF